MMRTWNSIVRYAQVRRDAQRGTRIQPRAAAALAAAVVLGLALPGGTEAAVYWADTTAGQIGRAGLDGSVADPAFITGAGSPCGVAVDSAHIYWANGSAIGRAKVDGSAVTPSFVSGITPGGSRPCGIAVDSAHVFWADSTAGTIGRANLDGSGVSQGIVTGVYGVCGVAVDGSHLYWAYEHFSAGIGSLTIGRANLDGTSPNPTFVPSAGGQYFSPGTCGVAVDSAHVYWTWSTNAAGGIGRANLDGTSPTQNFIAAPAFPCAMAISSTNIFWDNQSATGELDRASIDGTSVQKLLASAYGPCGIAVDSLLPATVTITPSQSPIVYGQPLSFTGQAAGAGPTATGTLTFTVTGEPGVPVALDGIGHASFAPAYHLNVGDAVTARYGGDSHFSTSTGTLTPKIQQAPTSASLAAAPNPSIAGGGVTLSAKVLNTNTASTPFGSVQFVIDGQPVDVPQPLDATGSVSGFLVSGLDPGDHTIKALYHDDTGATPDFSDSQAAIGVHVNTPVPTNSSPPKISGSAVQGQTLSLTHGNWGNSPTGYSDQWEACDASGANCRPMATATGATYTLTGNDVSHTIRVSESASNPTGTSSTIPSLATARVEGAPMSTSLPAITGSPVVGNSLSASTGSWTGATPLSYAYQWQRCSTTCAAIVGATSISYNVKPADLGNRIQVVVTTSNGVGSTAATSAAIGPALAGRSQITSLLRREIAPDAATTIRAVLRAGGWRLAVVALEAGEASLRWTATTKAGRKPILVATGSKHFVAAGTKTIKVRLTKAGRRLLASSPRPKVTATGVFIPTGQPGVGASVTFTVKR